jgi:hypothetical protein
MSTLSQFFLSSLSAKDFPLDASKRQYIEGGTIVCKQGNGTAWIVAQTPAEVSRSWYCRDDAVTRAQAITGCTGWFVPTSTQLQNPGYVCRTFWESFSAVKYWSSNPLSGENTVCYVNFASNTAGSTSSRNVIYCVRAFRCVTY